MACCAFALFLVGQALAFFAALLVCLVFLQAFAQIPPGLSDARIAGVILFPAQLLVAVAFWFLTTWLSRTLGSLQQAFAERRADVLSR